MVRLLFRSLLRSIYKQKLAYLLVFPTLAFLALFVLRPLINGVWLGFTKTHLLTQKSTFIGLENYIRLLTEDRIFWKACFNTLLWTVAADLLIVGLGLLSALLLNMRLRFIGIFRSLILIPWVLPTAVVALIWNVMYWEDFGIINSMLASIGLLARSKIQWLVNSKIVIFSCVMPFAWWRIPFSSIMILAGLQVIPIDLYEASSIDGARPYHRFFYITLPQIEPILATVLLVSTIYAVNEFSIVWILTGGGPANSSQLLSTYSYASAFNYLSMGYGAAIADTLFLIMFPFGFLYLKRLLRD